MARKVNLIQLRREIAAQEAQIIQPRMKVVMNEKFEREKKRLLRKFDDDATNKELAAGAAAQGTIAKTGRGGNLYSFFGFVDGVNPIEELRNALEDGVTKGHVTKATSRGNILKYNLEVRVPTMEELKRKTELFVWTTRSFIDLVERGVSNFTRYIFEKDGFKTSRSGTGIQINHDIRGRRELRGRSYITKMIQEFTNRLKGFNNR